MEPLPFPAYCTTLQRCAPQETGQVKVYQGPRELISNQTEPHANPSGTAPTKPNEARAMCASTPRTIRIAFAPRTTSGRHSLHTEDTTIISPVHSHFTFHGS